MVIHYYMNELIGVFDKLFGIKPCLNGSNE